MTEPRNLHLHGSLAEQFGAVHEVVAGSLPDALRIVNCNHPGFLQRIRRGSFHCLHGSPVIDDAAEIAEHHLFLPRQTGDFHLVPAAEGAKGRTGKMIFSLVVGGALLATGIGGAAFGTFAGKMGFMGQALGASTGFLGLSYGTVALIGGAMMLGGLSQLLTPTPTVDSGDSKPTSFTFGGPSQVNEEGGPIPLIYGEVVTSGVTIASSIRDGYGSTSPYDPFGGGGGVTTGGGVESFHQTIVQQP
jgi:predicted phage tail protein